MFQGPVLDSRKNYSENVATKLENKRDYREKIEKKSVLTVINEKKSES